MWLLRIAERADDPPMTQSGATSIRLVRRQQPDPTGLLICAAARGDSDAFARLYDDVAELVYGVARRVLRDQALAEEVTQDVLLAVWQQASRYNPASGSGRAWIMMIAHRRAIDRVRSEQAARDRNDRYARGTAICPFDEVLEVVETRADHSSVAAAVAHLTPAQRQALTLAYFGGHTYREVAQLLDLPLGTVKTRIRDGLICLRQALAGEEHLATSG